MPANGLPMVKNESQGNMIAMRSRMVVGEMVKGKMRVRVDCLGVWSATR